MAYKHILIAVDLSPESKVLVEKAVSMARPYNAKVSLIHVDVNYSDLYTGLIDVNLGDMQKRISEETHHALDRALDQRRLSHHRDPERQRRPWPGAGRCD
ncbi:Universal stress protein A [Klebsiella pneumoniae]|uniref:Universal stress protein A n=1 Tax=Klebsiella pneumoniae TaxID=573 RepID=A0A3S5DHM0_KLEPN|nr:Universal stress protein A [Klebsiella pneumoniae]